jgi:nitrite reductase/ring-hydroxylating ferredoxin subunit
MELKIATTKDLAPGQMTGIEAGGQNILLANVEGNFYAIGNVCTHEGCSLSEGILTWDNVECLCHGSTFNIKTGAVVKGPAVKAEPSYQLRVQDGQIFLTS